MVEIEEAEEPSIHLPPKQKIADKPANMQKDDSAEINEPSRLAGSNTTGTKSNSNLGQARAKSGYGVSSTKARAVHLKRKDSATSSKKSKQQSVSNKPQALAHMNSGTQSAGFKNLNFKGSKVTVGKVSANDVNRKASDSYINMNKQ